MKKIAVIDPASYTLPYDYYWLKSQKNYEIDFYCSLSNYSNGYLDHLKALPQVNLKIFNISQKNKLAGAINYLKLLTTTLINQSHYEHVHFQWSILFALELPYFILLKSKLFFTFHNPTPHRKAPNPHWPFFVIFLLAKKIFFVSNHTLTTFIEMYQIKNQDKISLDQHPNIPISPKFEAPIIEDNLFEKTLIFWGNVKHYKGVDFFLDVAKDPRFTEWRIEIWGKWDKDLKNLKSKLKSQSSIQINDMFLSDEDIYVLFKRNALFILPYKSGSQSGVVYTLKYYNKKFLCTPVGDQSTIEAKYHFNRSNLNEFLEKIKSFNP